MLGVGLLTQQIDDTLFHYLLNAHGDVLRRVGDAGNSAPLYRYDTFGNQRDPQDTDPNPFRYCGEYFDTETGTVYLRARYYNPRNGRFCAEDSIRDGVNWYGYCNANPITFVDPSGHFATAAVGSVIKRAARNFVVDRVIDYGISKLDTVFPGLSSSSQFQSFGDLVSGSHKKSALPAQIGNRWNAHAERARGAVTAGRRHIPAVSDRKSAGGNIMFYEKALKKLVGWTEQAARKDAEMNAVYRLMYVSRDDDSVEYAKQFPKEYTYVEAVFLLNITGTVNLTMEQQEIKEYSEDMIDINNTPIWGIYTKEQAHAYALASALGLQLHAGNDPEVPYYQKSAAVSYGHYHAKYPTGDLHVWFGDAYFKYN